VLGRREHRERSQGVAVRLHGTGISLRETAAALESIGVFRSHQAVFQWVHRVGEETLDPPTAEPSRVAVDETAIQGRTHRAGGYHAGLSRLHRLSHALTGG
jgi:putative transposase